MAAKARLKKLNKIDDQSLVDLLKSVGNKVVSFAENDEVWSGFIADIFDSKSRKFRMTINFTRDTLDVGEPIKVLYE